MTAMIITQDKPFSRSQAESLHQAFPDFIKTVIDLQKKTCSAGADRHVGSEQILLEQDSRQSDLWGGGIYPRTQVITFDSAINIHPDDSNRSNELLDPSKREEFEKLTNYFFAEFLHDQPN